VIDVHSERQLTQLEANLVLAGPRTLRWVVYELANGVYESRYDKVLIGQSGNGYLSSGPLSYTLESGKRYLLGLAVSGGGFAPYYDSPPWQPNVSFGRAAGSLVTNYSPSINGGYVNLGLLFDLRLTTTLP
jgi:hypothetical protein